MTRKACPTDVSDEKWAFVAPYLTLMTEAAPQREHSLREVFNRLRWMARAGGSWRLMPHDLPPWAAVYQQTQRWVKAGVFEAMVNNLRELLRLLNGRNEQPSAVILNSRTLQSTVESGSRAGYDGGKRRKDSKVVKELAQQVQAMTGESVEVAFVDQGYTREQAATDAQENGIRLEVVKLPEAKRGLFSYPEGGWWSAVSGGWLTFGD